MLYKLYIQVFRNLNRPSWFTLKRQASSKDHLTFLKETRSKFERPDGLRRKTAREKVGIGGYLLVSIPLTTFGLGVWQVQRKQWKEDLIKSLEKNLSRPAVPIPEHLIELDHMEYHTVSASGYFLHDRELFLGPRSLISQGGSDNGGGLFSVQQENMGYLVITPFKLENRE